MPFIDCPTSQLRTFYVCNPTSPIPDATGPYTPEGSYAPFDPAKPSLVFLTAGCRTLSSLQGQFDDRRLRNHYNLVAVAGKYHDRTHKVVDGKLVRDEVEEWTLVKGEAGIREALTLLESEIGLTEFVLFGEGIAGSYIATLLAAHLPARVLGLILSNPGRLSEDPSESLVARGLKDILSEFLANKDGRGDGSGSIPRAVLEENNAYCFGGMTRSLERVEGHMRAFQLRYGTGHSSAPITHCFEQEWNRTRIPLALRQSLTLPILILHGAADTAISPAPAIDDWRAGFANAKGGVDVRVVADGPHLLSFIDFGIVNRFISGFAASCVSGYDDPARRVSGSHRCSVWSGCGGSAEGTPVAACVEAFEGVAADRAGGVAVQA